MKMVQNFLVSTRVISTVCHLLALIVIVFTREANIEVGLSDSPSDDRKQWAHDSTFVAVAIGLFCFMFDIISLLGGYSIFITQVNIFQILSHFCGGILLSWFISESWNYEALWPIVISCNVPVAIVEISILLSVHVFKTMTP